MLKSMRFDAGLAFGAVPSLYDVVFPKPHNALEELMSDVKIENRSWKSVIPFLGFALGALAGVIVIGMGSVPAGTPSGEAVGLLIGGAIGAGLLPGVLGYCIGARVKRSLTG